MRKLLAALGTAILLTSNVSYAGLIASGPVKGLDTFTDTSTGLIWLRLPDLFNLPFAQQVSIANAAGFTVARDVDLRTLWADSAKVSAGYSQWDEVAAIIGSSDTRGIMWGNYNASSLNTPVERWGWSYRDEIQWNTSGTDRMPDADLGLWAFQRVQSAGAVPEPSSLWLLIAAALGFAAASSRHNSAIKNRCRSQ